MPTLKLIRGEQVLNLSFTGSPLLSDLLDQTGIVMHFPCGRRGICGNCGVEVSGEISKPSREEEKAGKRLGCQVRLLGDAEARIPSEEGIRAEGRKNVPFEKTGLQSLFDHSSALSDNPGTDAVVVAADIGTTTIVTDFYDQESGRLIASCAADNPQRAVSADVIGRIQAAMNGKALFLQKSVQDCLLNLAEKAGLRNSIREWICTGNTTMLTLLSGMNPEPLSQSPFQAENLFDAVIELDGKPAYLPPCLHAFIGADVLCSLLFSGVTEAREASLLCDIGTNGEIVLWKGNRGWAISAAAGPALEGVGIRQGCAGFSGAIDRVSVWGETLLADTINHQKAKGICGSGALDAAACGLSLGYIDPEGGMEEPMLLRDGISLYPEDVRQIQLAKSAIAAGMEILLRRTETEPEEIRQLILCGGFGSRMNPISAARIGLISSIFLPVTRSIGNAALEGAAMLRFLKNREKIRAIRNRMVHLQLGGMPDFNEAYLRHLRFPLS